MKLLSTAATARYLSLREGHTVSQRRVQTLIEEGRLKAEKVGRSYVIREADLARLVLLPPHRPKKPG